MRITLTNKFSAPKLVALLISLGLAANSFSQVSIRERVSIDPGRHSRTRAPMSVRSDSTECTIGYINPEIRLVQNKTPESGIF